MVSARRYEPVALIGRGGNCEIWLGVLRGAAGFLKPVVLKRASAAVADDIEEAQRLLVSESHVSSALNHPNIVHIYELVDLPEGVMLAMEYLSGLSLRAILSHLERQSATLPWPIAARIVADSARGLSFAHGALGHTGKPLEIIHRDVSPENLVVTEQGIAKVVDFGIARSTLRDATTGLVIKGKLAYMSPEQIQAKQMDWRSDVFSLGIVLYEALTGIRLFERDGVVKTSEAVLQAPIPRLPDSVTIVVRDVVRRMLVRTVGSRSISMGEVADTLEAAAAYEGGSHRDVATFLEAELGGHLESRQQKLQELLSKPVIQPATLCAETAPGTMALLESALDELPEPGTVDIRSPVPVGQSHSQEETTIADKCRSGTFVERPLLKLKKKT